MHTNPTLTETEGGIHTVQTCRHAERRRERERGERECEILAGARVVYPAITIVTSSAEWRQAEKERCRKTWERWEG